MAPLDPLKHASSKAVVEIFWFCTEVWSKLSRATLGICLSSVLKSPIQFNSCFLEVL